MIFAKHEHLSKEEIGLVKNFLEDLIGQPKTFCRKKAEEFNFTFLDEWDKKMGFVKEIENKYLIMSLSFKDAKCHFYQVITKKAGAKWTDSQKIDYNIVRETGVISD